MNTSAIGITVLTSLLSLLHFLQPGSAIFLDQECGIRASASRADFRIIHGTNARANSSPWMVFISTTNDYFICGGTLITNRFVLTAAHCYHKNRHLKVRLGEFNRDWEDDTCHDTDIDGTYCVERVELFVDLGIMHPSYNPRTHDNDIAILRMARRAEYTDNIRPICIVLSPSWRYFIDNLNPLTVTGWGHTSAGGLSSRILQTLDIDRQPKEICTRFVEKTPSGNEFCVGNRDSSVCNGDSGGPAGKMIWHNSKERFIQIGIASAANHQCSYASIFTDVLSHGNWIKSTVEQYGNGHTRPIQVSSPTWQYPSRVVSLYDILWPGFQWSN